jgi:hypothetical protein
MGRDAGSGRPSDDENLCAAVRPSGWGCPAWRGLCALRRVDSRVGGKAFFAGKLGIVGFSGFFMVIFSCAHLFGDPDAMFKA